MAKQQITQLIDDLDGQTLEDGVTIHFSLEGHTYEIDLSETNADKLREAFRPFVEAGRPIGSSAGTIRSSRSRSGKTKNDLDLGAVRTWARENGYEVSDRGRVPAAVLDAYHTAHSR